MLKRTSLLLCALTIAATAAAQEVTVAPQLPEQQAPRSAAQAANIRIELTITDQRSDSQTPPKTVTLLVEDRQNGRLRTGRGSAALNLDARPEIVREGRIRVGVALEYTPQDSPERQPQPPIQESVTALLEDGKPLLISQSADPVTDRKVRVEVKATVVR
jgi:hypothetical protein